MFGQKMMFGLKTDVSDNISMIFRLQLQTDDSVKKWMAAKNRFQPKNASGRNF